MNKIRLYIFFLLLIFSIACDEGLQPSPPIAKSYLSGLITYIQGKDKWPPADSVIDIRVVAFKNYPPKNILEEITKGEAFFTNSLPFFVDTSSFFLEIPKPPITLKYIVVAQQYASLLDWRVVGVWTLSGDYTKPSSIDVEPGASYPGLNINVDFENLPPQPFD